VALGMRGGSCGLRRRAVDTVVAAVGKRNDNVVGRARWSASGGAGVAGKETCRGEGAVAARRVGGRRGLAAIATPPARGNLHARHRWIRSWNKYQVDLGSRWRGIFVFLPSL
jgi:hypothetical protein